MAERHARPVEVIVGLATRTVAQIEQDLEILQDLAARATRRSILARSYDLQALVEEFTETIRAEVERMQGIKVSDVIALDAARIDRKLLAGRATAVLLKMVFEDRF